MTINWYPGQMAKARQNIKKKLKLIDLVVEIRDARIPESSKNPEIETLLGNKPRLVILNKEDLADGEATQLWQSSLEKHDHITTLSVSAQTRGGVRKALDFIKDFREKRQEHLTRNRPLRIMVVGIPNVGKSTLVNRLSGTGRVRTGNRPGITKGEQWIRLTSGIELLDTPGLLWPKFDNPEVAFKLAVTGAIKYELLDDYALAVKLLEYLLEGFPNRLHERYRLEALDLLPPEDVLQAIGRNRGALRTGGVVDIERTAELLLVDFRLGRLGQFTLDSPPLT